MASARWRSRDIATLLSCSVVGTAKAKHRFCFGGFGAGHQRHHLDLLGHAQADLSLRAAHPKGADFAAKAGCDGVGIHALLDQHRDACQHFLCQNSKSHVACSFALEAGSHRDAVSRTRLKGRLVFGRCSSGDQSVQFLRRHVVHPLARALTFLRRLQSAPSCLRFATHARRPLSAPQGRHLSVPVCGIPVNGAIFCLPT